MITGILNEILKMFLEMGPYILLGLLFVGILSIVVSKDMVTRQVGKKNIWSVFKAALFGIPLPLCSCGVVPTTVFMAKNGASRGATTSFLISTPQTGIDSIIATYGILGPVFAIFRPIAALIMGVVGGLSVEYFDKTPLKKTNTIELNQYSPRKEDTSFSRKIKKAGNYAFIEFLDDIAPQFIVGVIIAGLISYFIPDNYFKELGLSNGIVAMLAMIVVGIPMYVCATASIPIAMSLMMKGFSPGVAFVFLVVGPATNAASLAILGNKNVLGKRSTIIYLSSLIIMSVLFGYLLDFIFKYFSFNPVGMMSHNHGDGMIGMVWQTIFSIILGVLLIFSFYRLYFRKYFNKGTTVMEETKKVGIEGMNCNHCAMNVQKTISNLEGVEAVDVRLDENAAYIQGKFDREKLIKAIDEIGYKVVS